MEWAFRGEIKYIHVTNKWKKKNISSIFHQLSRQAAELTAGHKFITYTTHSNLMT